MMKKVFSIAVVMLMLGMMVPVVNTQAQEVDRTFNFFQGLGEQLADEVVYKQIEAVARPACQLYGLGVDVVNFLDVWNIQNSLVDITVLFRNEDWRELIWAIDDRRDVMRDRLVGLKQQQCLLNFSIPELVSRGRDDLVERLELQKGQLDRAVEQVEITSDYFAMKKKQMTFDKPVFFRYGDADTVPDEFTALKAVPTDKIYHTLLEVPVKVDWEQYERDTREFFRGRLSPAFEVFFNQIPEGCFAFTSVLDDQLELFLYTFNAGLRQSNYQNFEEFLQKRALDQAEKSSYSEVCKRQGALSPLKIEEGQTSLEEQYENFASRLTQKLEFYTDALGEFEKEVVRLENQQLQNEILTKEEEEKLQKLSIDRAYVKASIEYDSMVIAKLRKPGETSLAKIGKSLASLVEALLVVRKDNDGKVSSKISLAERFQKRQEKTLQSICARISTMYSQSGRSTSDLPIIGSANGKVYCRARPECANVNLFNLSGISSGDSKLAECSGFLFNSSELGLSQQQRNLVQQDAEDLGELLEEQALNDLLNKRNIHYASLRNRMTQRYVATSDGVTQLEQLVADISTDLFDPKNRNPYSGKKRQEKTHYGLLKYIYQQMYTFAEAQPGYCPAEEEPGE